MLNRVPDFIYFGTRPTNLTTTEGNGMPDVANMLNTEGVVIHRDADGYGSVEFDGPEHRIGVFTGEVPQDLGSRAKRQPGGRS